MSAVAVVVALGAWAAGAAPVESIEAGRLGKVLVTRPAAGPARDVVLLLVDAPGASAKVAGALAAQGALVLTCDAPRYLRAFPEATRCLYPAGDLEALAQVAEKQLGFAEYVHPVVVGVGSTSGLAYASLAQAPKGTFRGAVSVGFVPEVAAPKPICSGSGLHRARTKRDTGDAFLPTEGLDVPWVVLQGSKDRTLPLEAVKAFAAGTTAGRVVELPGVRGYGKAEAWVGALVEAVAATRPPPPPVTQAPPAEDGGVAAEDVSDLPLVEAVTPGGPGEAFAVFISGDGGWAGIDRELAAAVGAQGVPVVGLDSLRYFWQAKTPEQTAKDVSRVIRHYAAVWRRGTVVMLGYSRGADVLPATVNRLDADARARVKLMGQVAAEKLAEFEVHVTDFVTSGDQGSEVEPEVRKLGGTPLVCIFGDQETDESLCPVIRALPGVTAVKLPGGHHFGGDYAGVAKAIIGALPRAPGDAGR